MGFRTFDFKCNNNECEFYNVKEERFIRYVEQAELDVKCDEQTCEGCDSKMQKCISAPPTHLSWSLWRAGIG
jgi:hypothetical protein